ncbi:MFS transporter [Pseudonocardia benzenivorans]
MAVSLTGVSVAAARRARLAVALTFAANGSLFGSWAPRVPEVKALLGLSDGILGLALLAPGAGSLITLPLAGGIAARWGSGRTTRWALPLFFASSLLIAWAARPGGNAAELFGALFVFGAAMGALDVLMNAQGVTVEQAYGRSVLSSFHAVFSLGALGGTVIGSLAAGWHIPLVAQFGVLGAAWLVVVLPVARGFLPDPRSRRTPRRRRCSRCRAARWSRWRSRRSPCCSRRARRPTGRRCCCATPSAPGRPPRGRPSPRSRRR